MQQLKILKLVWFSTAIFCLTIPGKSYSFQSDVPESIDEITWREVSDGCAENGDYLLFTPLFRLDRRMTKTQECVITVERREAPGSRISRMISFGEDGRIFVFNVWGERISNGTGARVFYLFPRSRPLRYFISEDQRKVKIGLPSGAVIDFSTDGLVVSSSSSQSIEWNESPNVNAENEGGLNIVPHSGWVLDLGWRLGESPETPNRFLKVLRPDRLSCKLKNSSLLVTRYDEYGVDGMDLPPGDDEELLAKVSRLCGK